MFKEKYFLIKIFLIYLLIILGSSTFAEENYYLTLRNDKVNLRQGPSLKYFGNKRNIVITGDGNFILIRNQNNQEKGELKTALTKCNDDLKDLHVSIQIYRRE